MIERYLYTGYAEGELTLSRHTEPDIFNLSLFTGEGRLFLYLETTRTNINPDCLVEGNMKCWPDGTHWQRMMDVFHYSTPQSAAHWARHHADRKPNMRLAYLRPEMVSRYVFLHYQLQEERPKPMLSKFGSIYLWGNLLALYEESPLEGEDCDYPGCLDTHNTPAVWADAVNPAFQPWEDGTINWKYITLTDTANLI